MKYLYYLSGEHKDIAQAELPINSGVMSDDDRFFYCNSFRRNLAFTKAIYEIIFVSSPSKVKEWSVKHVNNTSKSIKIEKLGHVSIEDAKEVLISWLKSPKVNLKNPDETFVLIGSGNNWHITKKVWENKEDFSSRKSHNKPAPHPTALHPKLARAMINLANEGEILDPFCGAGGILLEAILMGKDCFGVDIDPIMVKRCKINFDYFNVVVGVKEGDALKYSKKVKAIVTDVPYGKNSKAEELEPLYEKFLLHAKSLTKKIVVGFPNITNNESLIIKSDWNIKHKFTWVLHRSLKKEIFVLELA